MIASLEESSEVLWQTTESQTVPAVGEEEEPLRWKLVEDSVCGRDVLVVTCPVG